MSVETIVRLHVSLDHTNPSIWRRVDVPLASSLKLLHETIQAAMGWENCYLWHFEAGNKRYGVPDPMWPDGGLADARKAKLSTLINNGVTRLTYTYDMGDDWRHTIGVEAVLTGGEGARYPSLVDGERRCPPEDVGGLPGFEQFLDAMADPSHQEHRRLRKWHGGSFAAADMDERSRRRAVAELALRRHAAKLAYQRRRGPQGQ